MLIAGIHFTNVVINKKVIEVFLLLKYELTNTINTNSTSSILINTDYHI